MDNHLNFFVPYERAAAWHENQLTRALLVVLHYSPMAHQAWLRLVAPDKHLHNLPKADFAAQRQRVLGTDTEVPEGEVVPGISVWLAPDAAQDSSPIKESDRQQILDGIVNYGTELAVVIENKIGWGGVTEQSHLINLHGSPVKFEKEPVSVAWQQLLGVLFDLVERDLVSGAERMLISDFLDFVEEHFPLIGPYSTLARCGDEPFRVKRRLDTILGEVVGTDKDKGKGARDLPDTAKIAMAWLGFASDKVCLSMWPGDTLTQSRALYGDRCAVDAVLALRSAGWHVMSNFHWGFMATGYAWANTPLPVEKYCDYWVNEIGATRELSRSEWETYWAKLESAKIVEADDKKEFDAHFTGTQRPKAHPRPGLGCEYKWPLEEAQRLDAHGKFVEKVRERLNQMLTALHEPLVQP
ncbi:MAG: hypothetical protein AWT59_1206 [Candidatus Gallionella acididurans]|uniref:Uncharacterized protein n=1 Tax=Candidatus Gallionella acididurans TaxID=1796491 RepID=A0A139BUM4_9PROT|nr:MAG: hypothetical protein AWT59_1206 [Candidatus Gallionella acididurans]